MELSDRQEKIIEIVKYNGPISGDDIAERLNLSRAALRADLAVLTMAGFLDARPRVGYFYSGKTMESLFADRIRKAKVKELKAIPIVIRNDKSLYEAIVTLFVEDVGTLFVVNEDTLLVGILSRKDLLKNALGGTDLEKIPVEVAMTRMPNVIVTKLEETIWEAARKLTEFQIDSLPVVREVSDGPDLSFPKYQVVGRITKTIVTKLFVEMGHM